MLLCYFSNTYHGSKRLVGCLIIQLWMMVVRLGDLIIEGRNWIICCRPPVGCRRHKLYYSCEALCILSIHHHAELQTIVNSVLPCNNEWHIIVTSMLLVGQHGRYSKQFPSKEYVQVWSATYLFYTFICTIQWSTGLQQCMLLIAERKQSLKLRLAQDRYTEPSGWLYVHSWTCSTSCLLRGQLPSYIFTPNQAV